MAIADLCGHAVTTVTEKVCGRQLRPLLFGGAQVLDAIFGAGGGTNKGPP